MNNTTTDPQSAGTHDLATDMTLAVSSAVHEAGHALAHIVTGHTFDRVIVYPSFAGWSGATDPAPNTTRQDHFTQAITLLLGPAAQVEFFERTTFEDRDDIVNFVASCSSDDLDELASLGLEGTVAEIQATAIVRHWWPAILRLTTAILEAPGKELSYDECLSVLGPRLGAIGSRAHHREIRRVTAEYAAGALPIYDPETHGYADHLGPFATPHLDA